MRLTRAVASARTATADTNGTVHVHTERYTCSHPLTYLAPHPLPDAHIRVQISRALPAATRLCNVSEMLVYRFGALGRPYQQHRRHRGPLPSSLVGTEAASSADCSHWWAVGITTSEVRGGAAKLAVTPPQTLSVTPGKQQHSSGPLGWSAVALSLWSVTAALVTVMSRPLSLKV